MFDKRKARIKFHRVGIFGEAYYSVQVKKHFLGIWPFWWTIASWMQERDAIKLVDKINANHELA